MSYKRVSIVLLLLFVKISAFSQCAMCKAVVESDLANGGTAGKGINSGIMYLMAFPYVLICIVGYMLYKHFKNKK